MLKILQGDWIDQLRTLPDESVQCCVTSPPYWGLRDYGVAGQLGLEKTPEEYVAKMVAGFSEVKRVLRDDGTLWLNLGDCYASQGGPVKDEFKKMLGCSQAMLDASEYQTSRSIKGRYPGLKPKDLCGIPWMVAFALRADGWYLRSDIIWHKPNPMPESVTDRPTKSHEYIFLLSKSPRYFYDAEAVKEKFASNPEPIRNKGSEPAGTDAAYLPGKPRISEGERDWYANGTRNKRTVWTVPSQPYSEAHFATFPEDLIKPCILAGTSGRGCCPKCGSPWERIVEKSGGTTGKSWHDHKGDLEQGQRSDAPSLARADYGNGEYKVETKGWQPTCDCGETKTIPCTVLDPFGGSGTTGQVALELGRKAVLIELNPEYVELIERRTNVTHGLAL